MKLNLSLILIVDVVEMDKEEDSVGIDSGICRHEYVGIHESSASSTSPVSTLSPYFFPSASPLFPPPSSSSPSHPLFLLLILLLLLLLCFSPPPSLSPLFSFSVPSLLSYFSSVTLCFFFSFSCFSPSSSLPSHSLHLLLRLLCRLLRLLLLCRLLLLRRPSSPSSPSSSRRR